jgi:NADH-quinone oxidoreductase subunit H
MCGDEYNAETTMNLGQALLALFIFPGLLYAVPMAWLMVWIERKVMARMQSRIGPPFYQPFFDFVKLMAKQAAPRPGFEGWLLAALPVVSVGAMLGALGLLPVFPNSSGFAGDLVLLVGLLEVPPLCAVLAGFASRSPFGQVGATREAVLGIAYNLPFLTAMIALASSASSLRLSDVALAPPAVVRVLALLALLLCLPVKLRLNPFSLTNAEQEIYSGPTTEFAGPWLAFWELAHGLEWVALTGLVVCLALPLRSENWFIDSTLEALQSLVVVLLLTTLAAGTARLKIVQATRFYWRWGMALALLALIAGALPAWIGGMR